MIIKKRYLKVGGRGGKGDEAGGKDGRKGGLRRLTWGFWGAG